MPSSQAPGQRPSFAHPEGNGVVPYESPTHPAWAAVPQAAPGSVAQAFAAPGGGSWVRISPRLTWFRRVMVLLYVIPVTVAVGFVAVRMLALTGALLTVLLACAAVVLGWCFAELDHRSWGFTERPDDMLITHGVFVKRLIVVPYGRMQFVDVSSTLLERWFGLATVSVHTAASLDARIPGLPVDDAVRLRDRLAQRAEARSMGL